MIELKQVSKIFERKKGRAKVDALHDVNLTIEDGDIFGIIGYSGAGKSTLIRTVNALLKPSEGHVVIDHEPIDSFDEKRLRQLRKKIGMIFQHFNLLNSKSVYANVALPLILEKRSKEEIRQRVEQLLQFVGLEEKAKNYPNELSGGQKQRVGIARALALSPSILLCDEATSALDPKTTGDVLQLLKQANEQYNITILLITHEMSVIQKICNKVAVLEKGKIIESGTIFDVFGRPQQQTTRDFVQNVIHDQIPAQLENIFLQKLDQNSGRNKRLVKLRFIGEKTLEPFIDTLVRKYDLHVNILFASTTEIQGKALGNMVIALSGDGSLIKQAAQFLKEHGILIKEIC